jgi:urease accessory protein
MKSHATPAAFLPLPQAGEGRGEGSWRARLTLGFEQRGAASVLTRREHFGPLRVQKALYPEGEAVCHAIMLHPPSGIAGGDQLDIGVNVGPGAHALLTTPGAGKWYRSAGAWAGQRLEFDVAADATLEWLPQENIVYDGARADMQNRFRLASGARCIAWDVLCLGRRAGGERFELGEVNPVTRIELDGKPVWLERGAVGGGTQLLNSPAGLAGFSVNGTLLATGPNLDAALLTTCRQIASAETDARIGITLLPDLLVARYLGHASEAARGWFAALWQVLRPALIGRQAQMPRIWNT